MSNLQKNSSLALTQFVAYYDLADNYGVVRYNGTVRFEYGHGQEEIVVADIQITRDGSEFRVNLLDGVPDKFPARFSDHFDGFEFEPGRALKISGNYIHSGLGKYASYIYHQVI